MLAPNAIIRPAGPGDLNAVASFVAAEYAHPEGPARYRRYLDYSWLAHKPDLGVLLEDEGRIRGFIGAIYSERRVGGEMRRFCNLTSIAVHERYRKHTLQLFNSLLARKDLTFTCYSANEQVAKILDFFRFERCAGDKVMVAPVSGLGALRRLRRARVVTRPDALDSELEDDQRAIARDHRAYRCGQLLVVDGPRRCFVVTVRRGRGFRAFADVLHASDPEMLAEHLPWIHGTLFRVHGTVLTGIDRRWLPRRPAPSFTYRKLRPIYARSSTVRIDQVDALYSELVALYGSRP